MALVTISFLILASLEIKLTEKLANMKTDKLNSKACIKNFLNDLFIVLIPCYYSPSVVVSSITSTWLSSFFFFLKRWNNAIPPTPTTAPESVVST